MPSSSSSARSHPSVVVAALTTFLFTMLVLGPGRNAIVIAVAALLPVIHATMSGVTAAVVAVVADDEAAGASWLFVLAVNVV